MRRRGIWSLIIALASGCADAGGSSREDWDSWSSGASAGEGSAGDGAANSTSGGSPLPPTEEPEQDADFRVPRASGAFVYSASEATDSVAVIDSSTLAIDVIGVGRGPTVIAPLYVDDPEKGAVAVLDQRSNDVALLETGADGFTKVRVVDVTPGANNLAVSPDGRYVFVHVDVDGPAEAGPGSDQELSVIDVAENEVHRMTVGTHPRAVVFAPGGERSYVITADGVNVIHTDQISSEGKPDIVPVYDDLGIDPALVEIQVAVEHGIAIARVEGERRIVTTDLLTGEQRVFALDRVPTDLDIAPDGSFALLTVPGQGTGSQLIELALPFGPDAALRVHDIPGEYVGLAQLAPTSNAVILYTTRIATVDPPDGGEDSSSTGIDGDDAGGESSSGSTTGAEEDALPPDATPRADSRLRFTVGRRVDGVWDTSITLFADRPIRAVGISPDGSNAILLHEPDVTGQAVPHAYTLVDLSKAFPVRKFQTVDAPPEPILFTPEGDRAVVLLRNDGAGVRRVEQVDLRTFIVKNLELGSPPAGLGYVDATAKVFVSQDHPTGRITFVDANGAIETVTGYQLNDAVKD